MKTMISNERVTLRSLEATDLEVLYRWENDTRLWTVSNITAPSPRSYVWQYLQNYDNDIFNSRQLRMMITLTDTGEPVGTIDIVNFDPLNSRAELGVLIDSAHQGMGLGGEALNLTIGYVRDYLGLSQLYALVPSGNVMCIKMLLGHGFMVAGELKRWINHGNECHDVKLLQLIF